MEMLVVLTVVGVVAAIAVPGMRSLMVAREVRSAVDDWALALMLARSEAVRQRTRVTVCPSTDGSSCESTASYEGGWIVKMGTTAAGGRVLQDFLPLTRITMTANRNPAAVTYLANGLPSGSFLGFRLLVQEDAASPDSTLTRYICVAKTGRPRVLTNAQWLSLTTLDC